MQFQIDYGLGHYGILGPETEKALQGAYISNIEDIVDERQESSSVGCSGSNFNDTNEANSTAVVESAGSDALL